MHNLSWSQRKTKIDMLFLYVEAYIYLCDFHQFDLNTFYKEFTLLHFPLCCRLCIK